MTETPPPSRHDAGGFEDTIKDFWASRPRRPRNGRRMAGVAAAVGNRYGIDPVVVRVALVAATIFGGIGIAVYLLGWLLFPNEGDEVSAFEGMIGKGQSSSSTGFTLLLCFALLPVTSWAFGGSWFNGGGLIGLALLVLAVYLLHRSRGQFNRPSVSPATAETARLGEFTSDVAEHPPAGDADTGHSPAWNPLGAAPFAWDLPDPAPGPASAPTPEPEAAKPSGCGRKSKVGIATLGVALLVAGVGAVLGAGGVSWFSAAHLIGLALAVLGLGMVVGAFRRGGRGLIGIAIPLALAGLVFTSVPLDSFRGGVGELHATPRTAAEVQPTYQHALGEVTLDLTQLPANTPITTRVNQGVGATVVHVPETADVRFTCENTAGEISCLHRSQSGLGHKVLTGTDLGPDGAGGSSIDLKVKSTTGKVEVRRG